MKYKCKVEGCNYQTDSKQGIGGHMASHIRRGEAVKKGSRELVRTKLPKPEAGPVLGDLIQPTPSEIAGALLNTVVDAIIREQSLEEQLRVAKRLNVSLTEQLSKAEEERDRVIRIHDEQVKSANKHGTNLPDTETLMKVAKLR